MIKIHNLHCWGLPKKVQQVPASASWIEGFWKTQSRQDKLLLKETKVPVHACVVETLLYHITICVYDLLTVAGLLSEESRHCYGLLFPSI